MGNADQMSDIYQEVLRSFVFHAEPDNQSDLTQAADKLPPHLRQAALAFISNISSVCKVASLPFIMAYAASTQKRYEAIFAAEKIRQLPVETRKTPTENPLTQEEIQRAAVIANRRLHEELENQAKAGHFIDGTLNFLKGLMGAENFRLASDELMMLTTQALWGVFEVLAGDVLVASLDDDPEMASKMLSTEPARKHLSPKQFSGELLAQYSFNLSGKMGRILFKDGRPNSLLAIRDLYAVLLPAHAPFHEAIGDRLLWRLWQRRHVIVHLRGIVDESYLAKTGDTSQELGSRLRLRRAEVEEAIELVANSALALFNSLATPSPAS